MTSMVSFGVLHSMFDLPATPSSGFQIRSPRLRILQLPLHRKAFRLAGGHSAVRFGTAGSCKKITVVDSKV